MSPAFAGTMVMHRMLRVSVKEGVFPSYAQDIAGIKGVDRVAPLRN